MSSTPKLDLEGILAQLEATIGKLEDDQTSLQESLKSFELGVKLTQQAQKTLREAEQKVNLLLEAGDGGPQKEGLPDNNPE